MDTSPRTYRFVPADIYTSGYRVVGKVMVANTGVIGLMNDTTHSAMEVHDARLAKIHMPTKLVDHFEMVRMVKRQTAPPFGMPGAPKGKRVVALPVIQPAMIRPQDCGRPRELTAVLVTPPE